MGRDLCFVVRGKKGSCMNFGQAEVEVGSMNLRMDLSLRRIGSRKDRATEARRYLQNHPFWSVIGE